MFGIRSEIPVMPAIRLLWEMMTPLGMPVDPLVYMMRATSEGNGGLRSRAAVIIPEQITQTHAASSTGSWKECEMPWKCLKIPRKNVFGEKDLRMSRLKKKRAAGCGAGAASGIC